MVNRHTRRWNFSSDERWATPGTDFFTTYAAKLFHFRRPAVKIWYADAGTRYSQSTGLEHPVYGTHSKHTTGANDINNTGLSRRHFDGANHVAFDLHARHARFEEIGVYGFPGAASSAARDKANQARYWSPIDSFYDDRP